jgi:hypothetical protein
VDCLRHLALNGGPNFLNLASPNFASIRDISDVSAIENDARVQAGKIVQERK